MVITTAGILARFARQTPRRRLLLPAEDEVRAVGLGLVFNLKLRRIVHPGIVAHRNVGDPPGAYLLCVGKFLIAGLSRIRNRIPLSLRSRRRAVPRATTLAD